MNQQRFELRLFENGKRVLNDDGISFRFFFEVIPHANESIYLDPKDPEKRFIVERVRYVANPNTESLDYVELHGILL
jgi:hypothetical protein